MREFDALLREHAGLIRRIADSYERDPYLAEDLAQDIAVALWHALPRFREASSLRTFIARVAHNRAASHVARARRRPHPDELDASLPARGPTVEEEVEHASDRMRLLEAVRALPISYRQAVTLWLEGFSMNELGDAFGISAGAAAVRMTRARGALRDALAAKVKRSNAG